MSFDTIKIMLTNSPILILPDLTGFLYAVHIDFKTDWLGVLTQERVTNINDKDVKSFLPITCVSGTFGGTEKVGNATKRHM